MTDTTPILSLPFIQPNQAQKHVTHNESLALLDATIQLSIDAFNVSDVPTTLTEGSVFALSDNPIGEFAAFPNHLAAWTGYGWMFIEPKYGWRSWSEQHSEARVWTDQGWVSYTGIVDLNNLEGIGIGASFDATNKLSVSSPSTTFSHEGSDHQVKINKNTDADSASVMLQSNWVGHAEIGLTGDNDLSIKSSSDGTTFETALRVDNSTGISDIRAVRSTLLEIENDGVASISCPSVGGIIAVCMVATDYPQATHSGLYAYDVGPTLHLATLANAPNLDNKNTDLLTGTAGTDGKSSIGVNTGEIVIENRFGSDRTYSITFIGGM